MDGARAPDGKEKNGRKGKPGELINLSTKKKNL